MQSQKCGLHRNVIQGTVITVVSVWVPQFDVHNFIIATITLA